ncbi:MAG: type II toxin-antitoxin system VapC family toxin [Actinomycetota bacterium]
MRVLIDSHIYVWWLTDEESLSQKARKVISDARATVHVSAASIWELAIQIQLGRLKVNAVDLVEEIGASGFVELPIASAHAQRAATLPMHHKDPFDRMLVAQAEQEQLVLITEDEALAAYGVPVLLGR